VHKLQSILLALLLTLAAGAQAQIPPDARWRTFDTDHFRVHYTEGLEPLARRVADRAERAYTELSATLVRPPSGRIDVLVADNADFANGFATPIPSNRIVVYAHPPVDQPTLAFYEDWLELVVTHELAHIFHLDYAGGIWRPLRRVLGRSPLLFPQIQNPGWVVEGLATYVESALTRAGRVRGTYHDMVLRAAILEDRFFPIDRATGDPVTWPGGATRYIYGSLFLDHLARRHGPEKVGAFVRAVGGSLVPYRLDRAARKAFGVSFTRAWREWEAELRTRYTATADSLRARGLTEPEVLTRGGRAAHFPRFSPDGATIAYAAATGREEPATRLILPGGREEALQRINSLDPASWLPGGEALVLSQLELQDPYRIHADLYRVERDGSDRRLTDGARVQEPHASPDGRRLVAVQSAEGTNVLVTVDVESGAVRRLTEPSFDVQWSLPRWSPRGDRMAVGRWRAGGYYDVVVLDADGRVVRELTRDRAVDNAPAWSPDGRYVLFSSDRMGIPNLYAYDLEAGRLLQVTNVLTGAFEPDVSPDGRWIAFAYYRSDGYHVARIPFAPSGWRPAPPVRAEVEVPQADPGVYTATAGGPARPYSPWPSVRPTSWLPALESDEGLGTGLGAAVFGADAVGRHTYDLYALVYPSGGRVEGGLFYQYAGLGVPVVDVAVEQEWSLRATRAGNPRLPGDLLRRERLAALGVTFPRPRFRSFQWLTLSGDVRDRHHVWADPRVSDTLRDIPLDVGAVATLGHSTVRGYAYSISPENGFTVSGTAQARRYTRPFAGDADATGYLRLTGRSRAYQGFRGAGFARHALAGRANTGADFGPRSPGFTVGGASGSGSLPIGVDLQLGRALGFPLRGYPEGVQQGDRAFSASAEYRFPLALVERGYRLLPLFLDRLWGDVFADAGGAWCTRDCERLYRGQPRSPRPLYSVGTELGVDFTVGYFADLRLRGGVAVPLRDVPAKEGTARPDPQLYLRFGRSF
jgi:Tol biopolymer transport system component